MDFSFLVLHPNIAFLCDKKSPQSIGYNFVDSFVCLQMCNVVLHSKKDKREVSYELFEGLFQWENGFDS